jgi:hypothetical protein
MKVLDRALAAAALALALGAGNAYALTTLPSCTPGVTCLVYGDFNVYSLGLLDLLAGGDGVPNPGSEFDVPSTYGAINGDTIIGINNGNDGAGNISGSIDGAYNTPSDSSSSSTFSTLTAADPGGVGEFTGDAQSWDANISSLLSFIDGTPLTAFFGFNDTGRGTGLLSTDMLVWAQVTLHDTTPGDGTNAPVSFYLGGAGTAPSLNELPDPNGSDFGQWVYVHAGYCVMAGSNQFAGFPVNGSCAHIPGADPAAKQNSLGQNAASFLINSPALDAALDSGDWDVLSITWQMAYIDGGGETAWIQAMQTTRQLPTPNTFFLFAFGLLLAGALARRRRR